MSASARRYAVLGNEPPDLTGSELISHHMDRSMGIKGDTSGIKCGMKQCACSKPDTENNQGS